MHAYLISNLHRNSVRSVKCLELRSFQVIQSSYLREYFFYHFDFKGSWSQSVAGSRMSNKQDSFSVSLGSGPSLHCASALTSFMLTSFLCFSSSREYMAPGSVGSLSLPAQERRLCASLWIPTPNSGGRTEGRAGIRCSLLAQLSVRSGSYL